MPKCGAHVRYSLPWPCDPSCSHDLVLADFSEDQTQLVNSAAVRDSYVLVAAGGPLPDVVDRLVHRAGGLGVLLLQSATPARNVLPPHARGRADQFASLSFGVLDLDRVAAERLVAAVRLASIPGARGAPARAPVVVTVKRGAEPASDANSGNATSVPGTGRGFQPLLMPMRHYVDNVLLRATGTELNPDLRYVFNTFEPGIQPGFGCEQPHPLAADFEVRQLRRHSGPSHAHLSAPQLQPTPSRAARHALLGGHADRVLIWCLEPDVVGQFGGPLQVPAALAAALRRGLTRARHSDHHGNGSFEFMIGPTLGGAHLHTHRAAVNALVSGRRRWVITPPHRMKAINKKTAFDLEEQPTAFQWWQSVLPEIKAAFPQAALFEFYQEVGEIVYIPPKWGHAVMNLEPSVAVSLQVGDRPGKVPARCTQQLWDTSL